MRSRFSEIYAWLIYFLFWPQQWSSPGLMTIPRRTTPPSSAAPTVSPTPGPGGQSPLLPLKMRTHIYGKAWRHIVIRFHFSLNVTKTAEQNMSGPYVRTKGMRHCGRTALVWPRPTDYTPLYFYISYVVWTSSPSFSDNICFGVGKNLLGLLSSY